MIGKRIGIFAVGINLVKTETIIVCILLYMIFNTKMINLLLNIVVNSKPLPEIMSGMR